MDGRQDVKKSKPHLCEQEIGVSFLMIALIGIIIIINHHRKVLLSTSFDWLSRDMFIFRTSTVIKCATFLLQSMP